MVSHLQNNIQPLYSFGILIDRCKRGKCHHASSSSELCKMLFTLLLSSLLSFLSCLERKISTIDAHPLKRIFVDRQFLKAPQAAQSKQPTQCSAPGFIGSQPHISMDTNSNPCTLFWLSAKPAQYFSCHTYLSFTVTSLKLVSSRWNCRKAKHPHSHRGASFLDLFISSICK